MFVYIVHVVCLLFIPQPPRPPVAQDRAQRQERETLHSMEVSYGHIDLYVYSTLIRHVHHVQ